MDRYPDHILDLITKTGFAKQFFKVRNNYRTDIEAYEYLEGLFTQYYIGRRYKDYESFRVNRDK